MDIRETREEILKRTERIYEKRERRTIWNLEAAGTALFALLLVMTQFLPMSDSAGVAVGDYGTLALGTDAGAYIIIGIICFLLGIIVTLIAIKKRGTGKDENK